MEKDFFRGTVVPQKGENINDLGAVNKRIAMERETGVVEIDPAMMEEMDSMTLEELEGLAEKYAQDIEKIERAKGLVMSRIEERKRKSN